MSETAIADWALAARSDPGSVGVFLDFDGTLAPIVADPAAASPHPDAAGVLARLGDRFGRVVVVSGRPVGYLLGHLAGAGPTELYGLYGLEEASAADPGRVVTDAQGEAWRPVVAEVATEAEAGAPEGVHVERKGLTVTLHYRQAPEHADWVEAFSAAAADRTGLARHGGKMSVELRPPVDVDKGTVIRRLAEGLSAVAFAGDDLGDLPAFEELRRLRRKGVATLAVASSGAETPEAVLDAADVVVDGPSGVVRLLDELLGS